MARLGVHDMGGLPADDPLDLTEHAYHYWERQTHALNVLLQKKGLLNIDEMRRGIEALLPASYNSLTYYEKWAAAIAAISLERGTITQKEIDEAMGKLEEDTTVKFKAGDYVRVKPENSAVRWKKPHIRTPGYIFGLVGVVERDCVGLFTYPEASAFRQEAAKQPLFRVRFHQKDIWEQYAGSEADTIDIEIFQPWLEPATPGELAAQHAAPPAQTAADLQAAAHAASNPHMHHTHGHGHHDHSDHHHHHDGEDGHDHVHEAREVVERNAVMQEGDSSEQSRLSDALVKVFTGKGLVTRAELREIIENMDGKGAKQLGPFLVAKAWADPDFKARLLENGRAAAAEFGISDSMFEPKNPTVLAPGQPPVLTGTVLTVVENTPTVHNLVVCTLCSCYPVAVLGMPPPWYKSRSYRSRAVREPRPLLAEEFGTAIPDGTAIRVHDSTADLRYMVLPQRPAGTEGWSEEQLRGLVTRDSLIGVKILDPIKA